MQINFFEMLFLIFIIWILLEVLKFINKKIVFWGKKCLSTMEQIEHCLIIKNNIDTDLVFTIYELIEKYFRIKKCYLTPDMKLKFFNDLDSFNLYEQYDDFIFYLEKEYKITVDINDKIIDLLIKIRNRNIN